MLRILLGIVFFCALVALIGYFATPAKKNAQIATSSNSDEAKKIATLSFSPSSLSTSQTASSTAELTNLYLDTGGASVSRIQVELTYNPNLITNLSITSPSQDSFFQDPTAYQVTFQNINPQAGRITYFIDKTATASAQSGTGNIATFHFTVQGYLARNSITSIEFLDKTMVAGSDEGTSILKQTIPLMISL